MILLKSTDSLQVLLAGAVAANQATLYAAFADMASDGSTFAPGNSNGTTNNTTAVSWVSAPSSGNVRQVKYLSIYNADTASITATVRIFDGTNTRTLVKFTLGAGERAAYVDGNGFSVFASDGTPKGSAVTSVNGLSGAVTLGGESIAEPVTALTSSAGALPVNCALGDYFTLDLTENITSWSFTNPPASGKAQTIMVRIKQHASSAKTVAWPSSFKWAGGSVGAVSTTLGAYDLLAITTFDQGTRWEASLSKAHS